MKIKLIILAFVAAALAGCASGKSYTEISSQLKNTLPGKGRIVFYRDNPIGLAVQPDIRINDRTVGKSVPSGFFSCDLKPGDYTITAKTESTTTLILTIRPGETKYVRSSIGIGLFVGRPKFEEMNTKTAKYHLKELKQSPSTCNVLS